MFDSAVAMPLLKSTASAVLVLTSAALPLAAQTVAASAELDAVVVTGTKRAEQAQEVTQSLIVLRPEDVRGLEDAFDALVRMPNVTTASRSALPTIRGLDGNGVAFGGGGAVSGGRPRFTTYIDGVPRAYSFQPDGSASLWDLNQIEIYRGSQSTTLGRNSIAGAMVVTTNDPVFRTEAALEAGIRSERSTWNAAAMANTPIGDQFALRVTAEGRHGENWRTLTSPELAPRQGELERQDFERYRAKLLFAPTALPGLSVKLTHDRERNASPTSVDTIDGDLPRRELADPFSYAFAVRRNEATTLQTTYDVGGGWQADAVLSYQHALTQFPPPDAGSPIYLDVFADSKEYAFEPKLSYRAASGRTSAVIGAYWFDRDRTEGGVPGSAFVYSAVDTADTLSLYGDARWQIDERWDLLIGARVEREQQKRDFSSEFGLALALDESTTQFLPKIGADYHFSPDLSLGALYYEGYNAGGGGVSFISFTPYTFRPENAQTAEVVWRSQWLDRTLTVNANLFYTRFDDLQLSGFGPGGFDDAIYLNARRATSRGLEVEASWRPTERQRWFAGIGLLRAKIDDFGDPVNAVNDGKHLSNSPSATLNAGGQIEVLSGLTFGANVQVSSSYYSVYENSPDSRTGGFALANATLDYRIGRATISAFVNNVFDRYVSYAVSSFGGVLFAQGNAPRTVGLNLRLDL